MRVTVGDRYISNRGRGPYVSRVVRTTRRFVTMTRWLRGHLNEVTFTLPRWFLKSPSCGWRQEAP